MKKIKVGVDARLLSRPLTGIGYYTAEMCRALSKVSEVSLILYGPTPFLDYLDEENNIIVKTGQRRNIIFRHIWCETMLPILAKKDKIDVFWGPSHRLPLFLSKRIARVVTIHDLVWKFAANTMRFRTWFLEKSQVPWAINSADRIIADCNTTAEIIKKVFHQTNNKLAVVFPGVREFKSLEKDNPPFKKLNLTKPFFLFVGTLEPRKNLLRLLKAYSLLPHTIKKEANLVIAGGEGWGNLEIEKHIKQLNLSPYVQLLGYVDELTLSYLYLNALFLAFPSIYEGFGLPLVEAMSCGLAVLTSNISCMPEIVKDAGLLVDPFDEHSISNGLKKLITDKTLRQTLSSKGKSLCKNYNWNHSATQLVDEFYKAIMLRQAKL